MKTRIKFIISAPTYRCETIDSRDVIPYIDANIFKGGHFPDSIKRDVSRWLEAALPGDDFCCNFFRLEMSIRPQITVNA